MTTPIAFTTDRAASRFRTGRADVAGAPMRAPAMTVVGFDSPEAARRAAGVAFDALRPWLARHRRTRFVAGPRRMLEAEHDGRDVRLMLRGVPVGRLIEPGAVSPETGHGFELALPPGTGTSTGIGATRVVDGALDAHATLAESLAASREPDGEALAPPHRERNPDAVLAHRARTDEPTRPELVARVLIGTLMVLTSLTVIAIAPIALSATLALAGIGLVAFLRRRT